MYFSTITMSMYICIWRHQWSPLRVFAVFPYSELITKDVNFTVHFDFIAQESGQYYSGNIKSVNEIDLIGILSQNGVDTAKLAFIKPWSGKLLDNSPYANHLDRFVFGFPGTEKGAFPFIVLGDAYGISTKPGVTLYPYGGRYRNMYKELGNSPTEMEGAYFLSKYQDTQGKRHLVDINLVFRCFEKRVKQLDF
ncbi:hypothetical protein BDE36_1085 [Arcticibacter tournemirensis]|nr:hypothetical protein BDE36_1085 [Arcticibacter tournemirensis]